MKRLVLGLVLLSSPALAQEPLYIGIDSIGAKPLAQPEEPVLFFEAKVHWPSLKIDEPRTAWEFVQRGMYRQDDLEDVDAAVADYRSAIDRDSHILIAHARLGTILLSRAKVATASAAIDLADEAIHEFREVLLEQPYRPGMHTKIAEALLVQYRATSAPATAESAVTEYRTELARAPQNQAVYYALAFLVNELGRPAEARTYIDRYLELAARYGDPYPYKLLAAERLRQSL